MGWSEKYKKSIDCDNPKGFSQRAHCQGRKKKIDEQIKPYKTVDQIAKKHRMEVSFIQNQLDMGEPIEHEHTKNRELAREIALQHLDEIPDYYTRLKKMEAQAKKHHKKFKDLKTVEKMNEEGLRDWFGKSKSKDGKSGWVNVVTGGTCASDEPGEGTPKCVSSAKRASMTKAERLSAARRKKKADPGQQEKSGAAKPTYVPTDSPRKTRKKMKEEMDLDLQETSDKPGKGSGKKDACYHKVKSRYRVWPSAYASGALVKCRKVGADSWGTKSESTDALAYQWDAPIYENEKRYCPKCMKMESAQECKFGPRFWSWFSIPYEPSNQQKFDIAQVHPANEAYDHEYSMARSELSTIIAAAKRLKKKMKGEGGIEAWVQSKITKAADYIDTAADYVDSGEMSEQIKLKEPTDKSAKEQLQKMIPKGEKIHIPLQTKPNLQAAHYELEGETISEAGKKCWPGYKKKGTQKLFGKTYNRCVKEGYSNWREELGLTEDWQKVNRQDKTDGLSQAAVDAYRRENPGSKLQTAVTEKKPSGKRAKRRANFCRRMKGMKSKLTSAKTARDPDSRINKALRRWNCR